MDILSPSSRSSRVRSLLLIRWVPQPIHGNISVHGNISPWVFAMETAGSSASAAFAIGDSLVLPDF
jgi:hypothetical protein